MKFHRILAVAIVATMGAACSQNHLIEQRKRTAAPTSDRDVGVILEGAGASQIEGVLARHPASSVRVLNARHGLYELYGITREQARAETGLRAENNYFFKIHSQQEKNEVVKALSKPAPVGLKVGDLNACKAGNGSGPTATLASTKPNPQLNGGTIEIGQVVHLSAAASSSPKTAIVIVGPPSTGGEETILNQSEAEFTPDALGLYTVVAVVQDSQDVCALDGLRFIVTANRPYKGPNAPVLSVDLKKFTHLAQVSAEEAWKVSQGENVLIAVIDTGVNYNHPALAPAIQLNDKEIPDNGIDDDGNGFQDDVLGYDFVNGDAYPYDDASHGSHVAGLAAGRPFGVAPKAKILPIKALSEVGGDIGTIAAAIRYAVDRGARIINMSLGGSMPIPHPALVSAVDYAESKGVLLVASAGNGDAATGLGFSIDENPTYPASLKNSNMVAVASFDAENVLSTYSNFGKESVHVVAPGGLAPDDPMISAAFENPKDALFIGMIGTSMASPVVSGIAADVWSKNPSLSVDEVKKILIESGTEFPELEPVTISGRHINALKAVEAASSHLVLF